MESFLEVAEQFVNDGFWAYDPHLTSNEQCYFMGKYKDEETESLYNVNSEHNLMYVLLMAAILEEI